jgi:hypothetical protein
MQTCPPQRTKYGDAKTLRWALGRDLTAVEATVVASVCPGGPVVLERVATIEDAPAGVLSVTLLTSDYGPGKIQAGRWYMVDVVTEPGPLTHPTVRWGRLYCEYRAGG